MLLNKIGISLPKVSRKTPCFFLRNFSVVNKVHEIKLEQNEKEMSLSNRIHFQYKKQRFSPWHDIPLFPVKEDEYLVNFVNEIPKGGLAKMEIATDEKYNPIKQDVKNGKLRFYHFESLVNYGCLPQTYEDPQQIDPHTKFGGDNDPIDVVEIGSKTAAIGEVYPVKVLGILGMIDDGETDWKVLAINYNDPMAEKLNDMNDLMDHSETAEVMEKIRKWFRDYKIPDGKPPSEFAFAGEYQSKKFARKIILETHESWKELIGNRLPNSKSLWTR